MTEQTDYLKFLKHLKAVWNLKEQCGILAKSEKFTTNDARNTFYRQIMNVINDYFLGMLGPFFMKRLDKPFRDAVLKPYFPLPVENDLFSNLGFLCEEPYLKTWHDMKKVGLVFTLWIVFEDTIDIIYQRVVSDSELEVNQYGNYNRIKKIFEGKLNEEDIEALKNKLKSDYIGINNKYNYILNALTVSSPQVRPFKS